MLFLFFSLCRSWRPSQGSLPSFSTSFSPMAQRSTASCRQAEYGLTCYVGKRLKSHTLLYNIRSNVPQVSTDLTFRSQVGLERMSFQSLKNLTEEVIVLISVVGFLTDDEGHVKRSQSCLVDFVQDKFPKVILFNKRKKKHKYGK